MNTGAELLQYFFVQTHNSKNSEDAVGLNPQTAILGTPVGFTLSGQQVIRGDQLR